MKEIWHSLYSTIFWCINNLAVVYLTLWLTNYRENKKDKKRFNNRIRCLLKELELNKYGRGNPSTPYFTKALDILVNDEPLIHADLVLFNKASQCLYKLLDLHTSFAPREGQILIQDLEEYLQEFQKKSYLRWYQLFSKSFKSLFKAQQKKEVL